MWPLGLLLTELCPLDLENFSVKMVIIFRIIIDIELKFGIQLKFEFGYCRALFDGVMPLGLKKIQIKNGFRPVLKWCALFEDLYIDIGCMFEFGVTGQQRMLTPLWHLIRPSYLSDVHIAPVAPYRIRKCSVSDFQFFSSPELKAQVSYSDRLLSVVRLSVCL